MPGKELVVRAPQPLQPADTGNGPPWQRRPRKESVTAWQWLRRRHHWTLPVFLVPAFIAAGALVHHFHVGKYVFFGGLVLSAALAILGPSKWNRKAELWYACLSSLAATIWLTYAAVFGVVSLPAVISCAVLAAAWGVFWWRHHRPRGQRKRQKLIAQWDAWWQSLCYDWNLGGSKVIEVQDLHLQTRVRVQGVPGRQSIDTARQVIPLVESGLAGYADIGYVRAEPVKKRPDQWDYFFKRENPLREPVEYDLALAPQSVHEMALVGKLESGSWKMAPLRGNWFVIGATRTGKSNHLKVRLAALTGCPDDHQILIDLKGGRSARPVLKAAAVAYVITEVDEARMCERMLVAEIAARAKYAYFDDQEQLLATTDIPGLHLLIDETNELTSVAAGDAECSKLTGQIAAKGSGLEIYVEVYTQHGSLEESVRAEQTRANLHFRAVYRVAEARHGAYVLPEYAKLDASKLEEQGTCYVKLGIDATAEQVRAPHMPDALLTKIAAQNAATVTRPPLTLYCGNEIAFGETTWQEWWDTRWTRLDPAFHSISPQYQAAVASSPAEAFQAMPEPPEPLPAPAPGEGDGAATAARINRELDDLYAGLPEDVNPPKVNLGPVIARQKEAFAVTLKHAPWQGISPTQLMKESGMSESWVYQQLRALVDLGAVTQQGRGRYVPVPDADIRHAMTVIKENADRLHREAKQMVNAT